MPSNQNLTDIQVELRRNYITALKRMFLSRKIDEKTLEKLIEESLQAETAMNLN